MGKTLDEILCELCGSRLSEERHFSGIVPAKCPRLLKAKQQLTEVVMGCKPTTEIDGKYSYDGATYISIKLLEWEANLRKAGLLPPNYSA